MQASFAKLLFSSDGKLVVWGHANPIEPGADLSIVIRFHRRSQPDSALGVDESHVKGLERITILNR